MIKVKLDLRSRMFINAVEDSESDDVAVTARLLRNSEDFAKVADRITRNYLLLLLTKPGNSTRDTVP